MSGLLVCMNLDVPVMRLTFGSVCITHLMEDKSVVIMMMLQYFACVSSKMLLFKLNCIPPVIS